ncbi:hypothetical protein [Rhodococcus sp. NPDC058514]|uniref:hypothetical protein n=1 Tax=unclassified Rhodococcus (in: high G+C Gram-positive bacteria) TaxID=192944 RepID=UPI00365DD9CA
MKIPVVLHHARHESVPILESARMKGRPKSWPSEKLERLLTQGEIEAIHRGRF